MNNLPIKYNVFGSGKLSLFFVLFLFGINPLVAQQWQWAETAGGSYGVNVGQDNEGGNDIEVATNGNLLITGYYSFTGVFDTISILGGGAKNAFVARYDSVGNVFWAHGVFGPDVEGISVKENNLGEIFLLGEFSDSAQFESDTTIWSNNNTWQSDIFLAKYDALGNFLWVQHTSVNTQSNHQAVEIEINAQNEIYLIARVSGPIQLDTILINAPTGSTLLTKFTANGAALWSKALIQNFNEYLMDMSLDHQNNVYITGSFQYNMIVNGNYILGHPTSDPFIMKFDPNGDFKWANVGSGLSNNWATSIDASKDGSVYVTGTFDGILSFDSLSVTGDGYYDDVYVLKLDSSGNEKWLNYMSGNGTMATYDLISDPFGNVYLSGLFWDSALVENIQLDAGAPWVGNTFVSSYQSDGSLNWAAQAGDINANRDLYTKSLALGKCGELFVAGRMKQGASFDNINVSTNGLDDAYFGQIANLVTRSISGNTILCLGDSTQLTAIGGANYLWLPDSVYGNKITVLPDSTKFYHVSGIACDGSSFVDSIEVVILELDYVSPPLYICDGDSAFILGAFRDTAGVYSQIFTSSYGCDSLFTQELILATFTTTTLVNDTICSNGYALIFGDTLTVGGTYTDTLSSVLGCDSILLKTLVIQPIYDLTLSTDTICKGDFAIIFGDTHFVSGTFIDTLFSIHGCDSVLTKSLVVDSVDTTITQMGIELLANLAGANYQWIDCNTGLAIPGATSQGFAPAISGDYSVSIVYLNCVDTSNCYNVTNVGVVEVSSFISIYPNPANEWVIIQNSGKNQVNLEVYNAVGEIVIHTTEIGAGDTRVSLNHLKTGMYVCVIKEDGLILQKTVLVKGP